MIYRTQNKYFNIELSSHMPISLEVQTSRFTGPAANIAHTNVFFLYRLQLVHGMAVANCWI